MTKLSRRAFIVACAAAMAVRIEAQPRGPVLYGDGIADDTEAWNEFLNGNPVTLHRDCPGFLRKTSSKIEARDLHLYLQGDLISIGTNVQLNIEVTNCHFYQSPRGTTAPLPRAPHHITDWIA